jgi:hypothetical protein
MKLRAFLGNIPSIRFLACLKAVGMNITRSPTPVNLCLSSRVTRNQNPKTSRVFQLTCEDTEGSFTVRMKSWTFANVIISKMAELAKTSYMKLFPEWGWVDYSESDSSFSFLPRSSQSSPSYAVLLDTMQVQSAHGSFSGSYSQGPNGGSRINRGRCICLLGGSC